MKRRWNSKFGVLICALLAAAVFAAQPALAAVTLNFEEYVHLGAFKHKEQESGAEYEPEPTPVLWQVRDADATRAVVLSHYLVDKQIRSSASLPRALSPDHPGAWATSSDLRVFLNNTAAGGFLESFNASERSLMNTTFASSDPAYRAGDWVTLPSLSEIDDSGMMGFADNDSRKAGYKTLSAQLYWLRSSGSDTFSPSAAYVNAYGALSPVGSNVPNGVGVRPASQISLNLIIFKSGLGSASNPYMLYTDWKVAPTLSIEADGKLKLAFPADITSADRWPAPEDFTLSLPAGAISAVTSGGNALILSPDVAIAAGTQVKLAYVVSADAANGALKTGAAVKSGDILAMNSQAWEINKPGGGTDPDPTPPSTETTPGTISVSIGGTSYPAEKQSDGTYLIILPNGTDLTNIPVDIAPPKGGTVSPDLSKGADFSKGPITFTVTAEDKKTKKEYTLEIRTEAAPGPGVTEGEIAAADTSRWLVLAAYNQNGTIAAEIRIPLVPNFDLSNLDKLYALLSGLTSLSFAYVDGDGDGNVLPLAARAANDPYLRIAGTAASKGALESALLSRLSYWLKNDATEYRQAFSPALKLGDVQITYTNEPPTDPGTDPVGGSSSGCDAGLGMLALLASPALGFAARRRR